MTRQRTMSKLWLVALYEYKRNVLRRRFILVLLSVPLVIAALAALIAIMVMMENNDAPVGYVDHAGLLVDPLPAPVEDPEDAVLMVPFSTEEEARAALEAEEIQAYYVLSANYFETREVELVYIDPPGDNATRQFRDFLQINLLADQPFEVALRGTAGTEMILRFPEGMPGGGREFGDEPTLNNFLPLIAGVLFMVLVFTTSGQLMQAVVEERENRMIEIVVTSISSGQLIVGKVVGVIAIGLTQMVTWLAFIVLAGLIGGRYAGLDWIWDLRIDWPPLLVLTAVMIPAYVLVAALMTAIGSTIAEAQEGQQVAGLFVLPYIAPLWFVQMILENPQSPLVVGLNLFPLTAPLTTALRLTMSYIPTWQIVASVALLVLSALGALWLAGQGFRLGMLRYGQRLRWAELLGRQPARGGSHE